MAYALGTKNVHDTAEDLIIRSGTARMIRIQYSAAPYQTVQAKACSPSALDQTDVGSLKAEYFRVSGWYLLKFEIKVGRTCLHRDLIQFAPAGKVTFAATPNNGLRTGEQVNDIQSIESERTCRYHTMSQLLFLIKYTFFRYHSMVPVIVRQGEEHQILPFIYTHIHIHINNESKLQ